MSTPWLAALLGSLVVLLAIPATSHAEESNPNNYTCYGHIAAGQPELGSEEQQVQYSIACDGPITGYQLEAQIPVTGMSSPPSITNLTGKSLSDNFSCSGEIPGYAVNCVGATQLAYETITGQFSIGSKLCAEPRVDPLLSVTYAYLEKGVVTQAISGPFDLGRPRGCPPSPLNGESRLAPPKKLASAKHHKKAGKKKRHKKAHNNKAGAHKK